MKNGFLATSNKINQSTNSSLFVSIVRSRDIGDSLAAGGQCLCCSLGLSFMAPASLHSRLDRRGRGRTLAFCSCLTGQYSIPWLLLTQGSWKIVCFALDKKGKWGIRRWRALYKASATAFKLNFIKHHLIKSQKQLIRYIIIKLSENTDPRKLGIKLSTVSNYNLPWYFHSLLELTLLDDEEQSCSFNLIAYILEKKMEKNCQVSRIPYILNLSPV